MCQPKKDLSLVSLNPGKHTAHQTSLDVLITIGTLVYKSLSVHVNETFLSLISGSPLFSHEIIPPNLLLLQSQIISFPTLLHIFQMVFTNCNNNYHI